MIKMFKNKIKKYIKYIYRINIFYFKNIYSSVKPLKTSAVFGIFFDLGC